jgi:hypothetical protein
MKRLQSQESDIKRQKYLFYVTFPDCSQSAFFEFAYFYSSLKEYKK